MSHIVTVEAKLKDTTALTSSLSNNPEVEWAKHGTFKLYAGTATGYGIKLKGWSYPIVVTETGAIKYDNYGGAWGEQRHLDKIIQNYAIAKTKKHAARRRRQVVSQQELKDGSVKVVLRVR